MMRREQTRDCPDPLEQVSLNLLLGPTSSNDYKNINELFNPESPDESHTSTTLYDTITIPPNLYHNYVTIVQSTNITQA